VRHVSPTVHATAACKTVQPLTCNSRRTAEYSSQLPRYRTVLASAAKEATSREAEASRARRGRPVSVRNCYESPLGAALGLNLGAMTICCSPLPGSQQHITTSRLHLGADFKCFRRQSCKPKRLINRAPQRQQNTKQKPFANSFCLGRAHQIEISITKHHAATTRTASTASPQCTRQLTPFSGLRSHLLCRTRELHCIAHRWSHTRKHAEQTRPTVVININHDWLGSLPMALCCKKRKGLHPTGGHKQQQQKHEPGQEIHSVRNCDNAPAQRRVQAICRPLRALPAP